MERENYSQTLKTIRLHRFINDTLKITYIVEEVIHPSNIQIRVCIQLHESHVATSVS